MRDATAEPESGDDEAILIVGGGMAGSLLALVLGRAGRRVVVFDPRRTPAPVFRNEKLGHEQIALLEKLGVLDCFAQVCWPPAGHPHAYPEGARPALYDCGAPHHEWLASVRRAWPDTVRFVEGSIARVELSEGRQLAHTQGGEVFAGRLLVLATGRMPALRDQIGVEHRMLSAQHSVCLGFSVATPKPVAAQVFPTPFGTGLGYVSLFPMPGETRVNVFSYRGLADPWTRRMSADPLAALADLAPQATAVLAGAVVVRRCEARATDLYETRGHILPGLVVLGDSFHAPCPASGTGMLRILNDIDVLTEAWLPGALATPGMEAAKVARFYAHPAKRRIDAASLRRSRLGRAQALDAGAYWRARRMLGRLRRRLRRA